MQHRSRWKKSEPLPNLRQIHLMAAEQIVALRDKGFKVAPGAMGENLTTEGLDLLRLPEGALWPSAKRKSGSPACARPAHN